MSATGEGHTATINAPTRSWQAQLETTGTSRGTASQLPALGSERQTPPADPASWWPRSERVKTNTKNVRVTADSRGKPQRAALLKPSSITDESGTSRHARSYLSAQSASCSVYHVRQHAEGSELVKYRGYVVRLHRRQAPYSHFAIRRHRQRRRRRRRVRQRGCRHRGRGHSSGLGHGRQPDPRVGGRRVQR